MDCRAGFDVSRAGSFCRVVLYENLALLDALRMGNARERNLAEKLFEERF